MRRLLAHGKRELAAQDGNGGFEVKVERIDYAARARDRLDDVLKRVGPNPAAPTGVRQRRAIAQQAFLMTKQAVEKSKSQPSDQNRPTPNVADRKRLDERREQDEREDRDDWSQRRYGAGLDIRV